MDERIKKMWYTEGLNSALKKNEAIFLAGK
jgi:hypothetical protein